jgi:hypothetical protein
MFANNNINRHGNLKRLRLGLFPFSPFNLKLCFEHAFMTHQTHWTPKGKKRSFLVSVCACFCSLALIKTFFLLSLASLAVISLKLIISHKKCKKKKNNAHFSIFLCLFYSRSLIKMYKKGIIMFNHQENIKMSEADDFNKLIFPWLAAQRKKTFRMLWKKIKWRLRMCFVDGLTTRTHQFEWDWVGLNAMCVLMNDGRDEIYFYIFLWMENSIA